MAQGVPMATAGGPAPVRVAPVVIGAGTRTPQADMSFLNDTDNGTLDALGKLLGGVVQQKLGEAKQAAYVDGIMRAQQGESAAHIQDSMIAGRMFGDGWAAQAARGYKVVTDTTDAVNGIMADMDNLVQLDPDQFRDEINNRVRGMLTDDSEANALVLQRFTELSKPLAEAHTRGRVLWQDEQAEKNWIGGAQSAAASLQNAYVLRDAGKLSNDSVKQLEVEAAAALQPMPGMRPTAVKKGYESLYRNLMAGSNFHALNILESSGVMDAIDPDAAVALRDQRTVYEAKAMALRPQSKDAMRRIGDLQTRVALGDFETEDDVRNEVNERRIQLGQDLGIEWNHVLDNTKEEELVQQWKLVKARELEQLRKQRMDQATTDEQLLEVGRQMFDPGRVARGTGIGIKDDIYEVAVRQRWETLSPEEQVKYIESGTAALAAITDSKLVIPQVQYVMRSGISAVQNGGTNNLTDAALEMGARMLRSPQGVEGLTAYVGKDTAALMSEMLTSGYMPGGDPKRNEEIVRFVSNRTRVEPSKADREAASSALAATTPGMFARMFGQRTQLTDSAAEALKPEMSTIVAQLRANYPGLDNESAVKMAGIEIKHRFDFIGGIPVRRDARKGTVGFGQALQQIPGFEAVSVDSPDIQDAFTAVVNAQFPKSKGLKIVGAVNSVGVGANHLAIVSVVDANGQQYVAKVTAGQVAQQYKASSVDRAKKRKQPAQPYVRWNER